MKIIVLSLIFSLFVSCSKKEELLEAPKAKVLDTSFLELDPPGTKNFESDLPQNSFVHVLEDDQEINIESKNGIITISNFNLSDLSVGDIIVGNEKDRSLFEVTKITGDKISIKQASLQDISRNEKGSLKIDFTPEIDFLPSEDRALQAYEPDTTTDKSRVFQKSNINPKGLNIIHFEDYELINTSAQVGAGNGIRSGRKTNVSLSANSDFKVIIKKGALEIIPTFNGSYELNGIKDLNLRSNFNSIVRYEFDIVVETSGQVFGDISFPLFKPIDFPITIPGPVPVHLNLELEFPAGMKIGIKNKSKVQFKVKSEYSLQAQSYYNSDSGASYDSHYDYVVNDRSITEINTDNNFMFELYFEPRIQTKIYKVLGPYAYINANLQADIDLPLREGVDDIFLNFSGGVGVTFDEPIFSRTLVDIKSPFLFTLSRGWDILKPSNGEGKSGVSESLNAGTDAELSVDQLDEQNRVAVNLRPGNLSPLAIVRIFEAPTYGKLVIGKNFHQDGLAFYYPPKVVEGKDSFQIQITSKGKVLSPSRINLRLSDQAKKQASKDPIPLLASDSQKYSTKSTPLSLPPGFVKSEIKCIAGPNNHCAQLTPVEERKMIIMDNYRNQRFAGHTCNEEEEIVLNSAIGLPYEVYHNIKNAIKPMKRADSALPREEQIKGELKKYFTAFLKNISQNSYEDVYSFINSFRKQIREIDSVEIYTELIRQELDNNEFCKESEENLTSIDCIHFKTYLQEIERLKFIFLQNVHKLFFHITSFDHDLRVIGHYGSSLNPKGAFGNEISIHQYGYQEQMLKLNPYTNDIFKSHSHTDQEKQYLIQQYFTSKESLTETYTNSSLAEINWRMRLSSGFTAFSIPELIFDFRRPAFQNPIFSQSPGGYYGPTNTINYSYTCRKPIMAESEEEEREEAY